jgi:hypothetical protein
MIHVSASSPPFDYRLLSNTDSGRYSGQHTSNHFTFIAPPPPPPLLTRSITHPRHTSHVGNPQNHHSINFPSNRTTNHARTPSGTTWIPPPPPPPIVIPLKHKPNQSSTTFQSPISHLGPTTPLNPQTSAYCETTTHHPLITSQAPHHSNSNKPLTLQTHTLSYPVNYNNYSTSRPPNPFPTSTHNPGSDPGYSHPHHPSYTYPTTTTPVRRLANSMLLTRTSTPFERGPFAAPSIPPQHVLLQHRTHALSPSQSQSQSQSNSPPPPRPPKPPELEREYTPTSTTPPMLPERTHNQEQSTSAPPTSHRVGGIESPTLPSRVPTNLGRTSPAPVNLGLGPEDVDASSTSNISNVDGGDKVSGSTLPAKGPRQECGTIENRGDGDGERSFF